MPRSAAASMTLIVAWPRSNWIRSRIWGSSELGATSAIVAAEPATWRAAGPTLASCASCSRSVQTTKSHACWLPAEGVRRAASRVRSRSSGAIARSPYDRTLRRDLIASQVSTSTSRRLVLSAGRGASATGGAATGARLLSVVPVRGRLGGGDDVVPPHARVPPRLDRWPGPPLASANLHQRPRASPPAPVGAAARGPVGGHVAAVQALGRSGARAAHSP